MANEISVQILMSLNNGSLVDSFSKLINVDQTAAAMVKNVQGIGFATHAALDMGSLTTAGYAVFQNLDDTNYVEVGVDGAGTFYPLIKLEAGEQACLRLTTSSPYAQANTAAVDLLYVIYED